MSKTQILESIRKACVPAAPLPALDGLGTTYADPPAQFAAALKAVAGELVNVPNPDALDAAVTARYPAASHVYSCVPAVPNRAFVTPPVDDPHAFDPVDLAVVPGAFGVAENGAVWVTSSAVPHRACLFLAQHLALVLRRPQLVSTMHAAYARLALEPQADFGVFISGPSKTADIEQCLVIGAHGARSLTVFLVD